MRSDDKYNINIGFQNGNSKKNKSMKFIGNVANGNYFLNIVKNLDKEKISEVYIAVAYASSKMELFDFCFDNKIRLKFWGRYDKTVPVATSVLRSFISRGSELYRCYLVKDLFHPKIYWFKGYGAYIGSANIGDRAWWNNVEAGIFFTEQELVAQKIDLELERFFQYLKDTEVSTMLNEDILKEVEKQERNYSADLREFNKSQTDAVTLLPEFRPKIFQEKESNQRHKDNFLKEWNSTLVFIREVMQFVVQDKYRPSWVPVETPPGVQVDQFLHAYYYTRTRKQSGVKKYLYEEHFQKNKSNIQSAIEAELSWWKSTPDGPNSEKKFVTEFAPKLKEYLSEKRVRALSEAEFIDLCSMIHAFRNVARYYPPNELGLTKSDGSGIEKKLPLAASKIFREISANGMNVREIIYFVLYSGDPEHVVHRLYEAFNNSDYSIPRFGRSCYGEIVGWAMPDKFPPRNDRTNKALRGLGYDVEVWNPGATDDD